MIEAAKPPGSLMGSQSVATGQSSVKRTVAFSLRGGSVVVGEGVLDGAAASEARKKASSSPSPSSSCAAVRRARRKWKRRVRKRGMLEDNIIFQ